MSFHQTSYYIKYCIGIDRFYCKVVKTNSNVSQTSVSVGFSTARKFEQPGQTESVQLSME